MRIPAPKLRAAPPTPGQSVLAPPRIAQHHISALFALAFCVSLLAPLTCRAQTPASLPLDGWYRTGRYMPVHIEHPQSAKITANGALPTIFDASTSAPATVPLLMLAANSDPVKWNDVPLPGVATLRPLSSHQQLVAVAGNGDAIARKIFPGESIIIIHVDPLDPIHGPAIAWQTLDALIVDEPWPGSLDIHKLPTLLAGGTEIAVHSPNGASAHPDDLLPWESIDGGWVLRPAIAGPLGCDGNDETYIPIGAWHPDLPAATRVRVVLAGILFSIISLACLLLPHRLSVPAIMLATLIAMIGISEWQATCSAIFLAEGTILVDRKPLLQSDRWQFITARRAAASQFAFADVCWPIFADPARAARLNMVLHWTGDSGRFTFDLPQDSKLAFISRTLQPAIGPPSIRDPVKWESPTTALARSLYLTAHDRLSTEPSPPWDAADSAPRWPEVMLSPAD